MRILKPLRLGLLTRPYQYRNRHHLGITVLALATMDPEPVLLAESELWKMTGEVLDEDEAVDLGIPKPCAEFLVSGKAYSHDPDSPGRCAVLAQVGDREKQLLVTGKRAWVDNQRTTEPLPVQGVPVNWRHAYGGPGHQENPFGIGAAPGPDGIHLAPQVEAFDQRMMRANEKCQPAGLGPISPVRPRRFKLAGDYEPDYLENAFPGLPNTLDPHYFNAASPDQWFPGQPELPPGAAYRLGNLHPRHEILEGTLPRWRARAFLRRHGASVLEDVPLRHTTVWFFPDHERMVLLFHGVADLDSDDGSDIALVMPALELADTPPRDARHYERVVVRRQSKENGAAYALRDSDLVPASVMRELVDMNARETAPLTVNMRQRALNLKRDMMDRVKEAGHDPASYGLTADLPQTERIDLDDVADHLRKMRRQTRLAKVDAVRRLRDGEARLENAFGKSENPAVDLDQLKQRVRGQAPGGPPQLGEEHGGGMQPVVDLARQVQAQYPDIANADDFAQLTEQAHNRQKEVYRHTAHLQQPVDAAPASRSLRMRRRVESLLQGSRDLSGLDLTGVDLSGLDLSGARCRGTWMESADLSRTRLAGADLSQAVLTRATLNRTDCSGADFTHANLGGIEATDSDFRQARFNRTVMDHAELDCCDLRQAHIEQCVWAGVSFFKCALDDAYLRELMLWQDCRLVSGSHAGARLERVTFLEAVLHNTSYARATLESCTWMRSQFYEAPDYRGATMTSCAFVETAMAGARFNEALLRDCNLRDTDLEGADFSQARLLNTDLSESNLRASRFVRADARESLFMGAYWEKADLRQGDFIDALMPKSDLRHADLRGANLFRTDVSQSVMDDTTLTAGAYVKQTKTLPRAPGRPAP